MKRIDFKFRADAEDHKKAEKAAVRDRVSVAEVYRKALREYLSKSRESGRRPTPTRGQRGGSAIE